MDDKDFTKEAYDKLFESKHHYDNLSWRIGGVVLVFAGALIAYIPTIKNPYYPYQLIHRLIVAAIICLIVFFWHNVYERNRIWVEAANEAIRDFERAYGVRGAGIVFMEAALAKSITLKNINERNEKIGEPKTEKLGARSMHITVKSLTWISAIIAIVSCFIP